MCMETRKREREISYLIKRNPQPLHSMEWQMKAEEHDERFRGRSSSQALVKCAKTNENRNSF